MWRRQKILVSLHQELETIALFDRVHDLRTEADSADDEAYASRQARRAQIMAEIRKLRQSKPDQQNLRRISSTILLLCAAVYATFHYLLK